MDPGVTELIDLIIPRDRSFNAVDTNAHRDWLLNSIQVGLHPGSMKALVSVSSYLILQNY